MSILARTRLAQAGSIAAAALFAATAAVPIQAAVPAGTSTTARASSQSGERTVSGNSDRRICAVVDLTGTRVTRRICKTQAEWEREGGVPGRN